MQKTTCKLAHFVLIVLILQTAEGCFRMDQWMALNNMKHLCLTHDNCYIKLKPNEI